jgi:hypothetical protein
MLAKLLTQLGQHGPLVLHRSLYKLEERSPIVVDRACS